jgi:hypothetical protein
MHHDAGGLVDHQQVLVLPRDAKARRLGLVGRLGLGLGQLDTDLLPDRQAVALRPSRAVDEHRAACDEPLGDRPRADFLLLGEIAVESQARGRRRYAQLDQERNVEAP